MRFMTNLGEIVELQTKAIVLPEKTGDGSGLSELGAQPCRDQP